ncbi:beta-ketoacyl-ACP synthase II [Candidatus Uabimicrobium amorphum]|uniref:3-oxoacyl-[acyl-carrier-protein] synthase 2 n=1 Tax=Uabimicrobium amorphum TaxID=2596890 RepID=A0A5S9IUE3_UABAM|nr:beta-ketoacyl-ACP synthase II [Candidatus Uabimicrobium amorphum]BBM87957.1 3-oxoacyl-[acyl-carrier-protein] synthase 2 [Candidatus Uabimicrobium amorphum]
MTKKRRVVITGLGSVNSLGHNVAQLWKNLLDNKSGIDTISKFDCAEHRCKIAGEVKDFDPTSVIQPRDVRRLDLFTQYALYATHEAIEDSKLDFAKENPLRVSVNLGSGMGGMTLVEKQVQLAREKGFRRVAPYTIPSAMLSAASSEVSIKYGFKGMNFTASAACASAPYAIGLSARMIQYGDADIVVSGGTEAIITPTTMAGFSSSRALSKRNDEPKKASRPFDKTRDGFVMGEGAGIVILEELEHAKQRNAKIYAEVVGVGWGADAYHITAPDQEGKGAEYAMNQAIDDAQIQKEQISYINAHGTSTKQNDVIETMAIKKVFGDYAYKIPVSSTKSMIGHLIGAAGGIECIVCALSVFHNKIHGTANYEFPDPDCDLDYVPNESRDLDVQYAMSNSFAFGGSNVSLVLGKLQNEN